MSERNPYLILGVDFGTNRDDARRHFAIAARRLRRDPNGARTVEDLTWALNEIESLQANPENLVNIFRVPANPRVFDTGSSTGLFKPEPVPLPRRTPVERGMAYEELLDRAAGELLDHLIDEYGMTLEIEFIYARPEE